MIKTILFLLLAVALSIANKYTNVALDDDSLDKYIALMVQGDTLELASGESSNLSTQRIFTFPITIRGKGYGKIPEFDTTSDSTVLNYTFAEGYAGYFQYAPSEDFTDDDNGVFRVTNIRFHHAGESDLTHCIRLGGEYGQYVVIDSCVFDSCGVGSNVIKSYVQPYGIIYRCCFDSTGAEIVQIWGQSDNLSLASINWLRNDQLGTRKAMFIERCLFKYCTGHYITSTLGSRVVSRYNRAYGGDFDIHDICFNSRGGFIWESYEDTVYPIDYLLTANIRGGTGVIYNTITTNSKSYGIRFRHYPQNTSMCCDEDGPPGEDQPGHGWRNRVNPMYFWGNKENSNDVDAIRSILTGCASWSAADFMIEGTHFINGTQKPLYVPYMTPHPFVSDLNLSHLLTIDSVANSTDTLSVSGGSTLKIYTKNAGSSRGTGRVLVMDSLPATYSTWTDTYIEVITKAFAGAVDSAWVTVQNDDGDIDVLDFAYDVVAGSAPKKYVTIGAH